MSAELWATWVYLSVAVVIIEMNLAVLGRLRDEPDAADTRELDNLAKDLRLLGATDSSLNVFFAFLVVTVAVLWPLLFLGALISLPVKGKSKP